MPFISNLSESYPLYSTDFLGLSLYYNSVQDPDYGYFTMNLVQDNKVLSTVYSNGSLGYILANIGGMAAFIFALIEVIIGGYQNFAFESALHSKLYSIDKKRMN